MKRLMVAIFALVSLTIADAQAADKHLGVASCASSLCHGSARPLAAQAVLQNEYTTWSQFDPHSGAYKVLLGAKSKEIARRMGLPNAHEAPACLACHAENAPVAQRGPKYQVTDGIGCEACHGGSERWLATHYASPKVTHADNLAAGLTALEDPKVRADKCAGCHVGGGDRFANHKMMAAGHPRLVFELDTYTELWRTSGGREHYKRDADYAKRKSITAAMVNWIDGLATSAHRQNGLTATHFSRQGALPDFAVYACYSCHRDLKVTPWQGDGRRDALATRAGELRLQDGHVRTLLVLARAARAPLEPRLSAAIRGLQEASGAGAGGVPAAAAELDRLVDQVAGELRVRSWTQAELGRVLDELSNAARGGAFPDQAAGEQAAMGMVLVLAELDQDRKRRADIDQLFAALKDGDAFDAARFARVVNRLQRP